MSRTEQRTNLIDVAVTFIASQPGGPARLLDEHKPNDHGLCCGCTRAGTGIAYLQWPCPIARLAQAASRRIA